MKYSDWRYELDLVEFIGGLASASMQTAKIGLDSAKTIGKGISGRKKTASQKKIIKTGGIKAARDMDRDGKLEKKRKGGEFQETLLYDIVHDYIIAENFASDTESANKIMLKLSDELMQEIYERMMTASEKRKDTMLKKKYDDSDMKKNMQAQYGKEEGKKVYFATIRKQAMKKEEVEVLDERQKDSDYQRLSQERGRSDYGKASIRNVRATGKGGNAASPDERGAAIDARQKAHKEKRGVKTKVKTYHYPFELKKEEVDKLDEIAPALGAMAGGVAAGLGGLAGGVLAGAGKVAGGAISGAGSVAKGSIKAAKKVKKGIEEPVDEEVGISSTVMRDKAKKEAMIRMKEREAVAKKLRKEEVKRDEYGDPVGGPKISKKQKEKNLKANTPDEQHTTTTAEGYGSDRVGPALTIARVLDKVNPRPKPNSKRTRVSRALKMASIKKDEKIRKRQENPYSADKRLKMVATSIRDRVKQKARAITTREDYIPEEGYDIARDMGRVPKTKDKKDATTMPPSKEMEKTRKVYKGPSALELVKKKYGKAIMDVKKK